MFRIFVFNNAWDTLKNLGVDAIYIYINKP